ncbi:MULTISPECIES: AraC family transcriptional regulator [Alcaligenaceae]|uniref:AraC family transcriptional regulator n=1 Tax=Alcaligenaceae TaxID=506 RepID=UPI0022B47FDA|nr:AraC family transcriptional regulator [Castellaniella sp. S9]
MTTLDTLLDHFSMSAGVFYAGNICGRHDFQRDTTSAHLHVIRSGTVKLIAPGADVVTITEPTLVLLPRPDNHQLIVENPDGADVICGTVHFNAGMKNSISESLPDVLMVGLADIQGMSAILDAMLAEARGERPGRQALLNRSCELVIIHLLRHCIEQQLAERGALAGLADKRIARALTAIHEQPAKPWTLEDMANTAGMSRARFALRFRQITGMTAGDYLTNWRMMLAQKLLKAGEPLDKVANAAGYANTSSFARVFSRSIGESPARWLRANRVAPLTHEHGNSR